MADGTIPYTQETRDLCNLAVRRTFDAIMSVTQLTDDPGQRFLIMQAGANQALAMAAGGYAGWKGLEINHIVMARGVLDLLELAQKELPPIVGETS